MTRPLPTTVTGQLVGRWINDLLMHIRGAGPALNAPKGVNVPYQPGPWDSLSDGDRERLAEVGHDLLVRLAPLLPANLPRIQGLPAVQRDYVGRRIGNPATMAGGAPSCVCGNPSTLGTVHRVEAPCYIPDASER